MRTWILLVLCCYELTAATPILFPIHDGERCGFADSSGKTAIPPQFQDCADFSEGLAAVQTDGGWGYIDGSGATVIAPQFLAADAFSDGLAFVSVSAECKAVIDRKGKILFAADYGGHGRFSEGLAAVRAVGQWICPGRTLELGEKCPDGNGFPGPRKWGYIDTSGNTAIPPRFFGAGEFHDGLAYADKGFIDRQGNKIVAGPYSGASPFVNGVAAVQVDAKGWGYIDKRGGWLALPAYDEAGPIRERRGLVRLNGKYGYVDTAGAPAIPLQIDDALPFSEDRAAVRKDAKWGYVNALGNVVIPFQFDAAQSFQDGFATVVIDSLSAAIDKQGTVARTHPATLEQAFQRLQGFEVEHGFQGPLPEILPVLSVCKEQLRELAAETLRDIDDPGRAKAAIEAKLRKARPFSRSCSPCCFI